MPNFKIITAGNMGHVKPHLLYTPEWSTRRAQWAVDQCIRPGRSVCSVVPSGFASYVRILPPGWYWEEEPRTEQQVLEVDDYENMERSTPVSWDEVAKQTGKSTHRRMQWWSVAPPSVDVRSGVSGYSAPYEGELTEEIIEALFDILLRHTGQDQECICAFWEGFGLFADYPESMKIEGIAQQAHVLFNSTIAAVRDQWLLVSKHTKEKGGLTPQAIWPTTNRWYFAVPFEHTSAYFGGPPDIAAEILSASPLETFAVDPDDDIWFDGSEQ